MGPPAVGWAAMAQQWGAIGAMAQAAMKEKPVVIATPPPSCERCTYSESKIKTMEEAFSRANATIDHQAATIVDLQGKLDVFGPMQEGAVNMLKEMISALQARDDTQRRNISHAERRVLQLIEKLREHEIPIPGDTYERWEEKPEPGDGTGLGAPASNP